MEVLSGHKSKGNLHLLEEQLTALFCSAQYRGDLIDLHPVAVPPSMVEVNSTFSGFTVLCSEL